MRTASFALALALVGAGCARDRSEAVSSSAYRGHESDRDVSAFVRAYPAAAGSRLDDCQTCHRGGVFTASGGGGGRTVPKNPCDYCHLVRHPAEGFAEPMPADYRATLNAYGLAYRAGGRDAEALRALDGADSDGDGAANGVEIAALRYPGDAASRPGQPAAPLRAFTIDELRALPAHTDFLLVNASRQTNDFYAGYRGVRLRDLLIAAGVDPDDAGFEGVTAFAPDGYLKDVAAAAINAPFPQAVFHGGLDSATVGAECGFVRYPAPLPAGVAAGAPIPGEQWLLVGYERDGRPMDAASLEPATGRIRGEGPLRLVVPQSRPGAPDRGSGTDPRACGGAHAYAIDADHNADPMVRGVIALRVNPLPPGVEDFDHRNGGWAFVETPRIVVYGFGVRAPAPHP